MSLASDSRKHASEWLRVAKRLPEGERGSALDVAEAWFELAMQAEAIEARQRIKPTVH